MHSLASSWSGSQTVQHLRLAACSPDLADGGHSIGRPIPTCAFTVNGRCDVCIQIDANASLSSRGNRAAGHSRVKSIIVTIIHFFKRPELIA